MNKPKFIKNPIPFLFLIAILGFALNSCKKVDVKLSGMDPVERFFKIPDNASPAIKRIIEDLKTKDKQHPFVEQFIANEGYPLWEYAKIKTPKNKHSLLARENGEDTIIDVPVVLDSAKFVKDILSTKLNTEILYKLFKGDEYGSYGFDKNPNRETPNADDIVGRIMDFEKNIWGLQFFEVTDKRLFDYWPQGVEKPVSFYISENVRLGTIVIEGVCPVSQGTGTGGNLTPCAPGEFPCWNQLQQQFQACEIHVIAYIEENEGEGGWVSTPPSGGGGGGGSSSSGTPPECASRAWIRLEENQQTGILQNPCTEIPIIPFFNPQNLYYGMGAKPLKEYSEDNRCAGLQEMWNNYPHNEVVGFVTTDGKLIVTCVVSIDGGGFRGLYKHNNPATLLDEYFYTYPVSDGAPSLSYSGMLISGNRYFIPVAASIHTHTPCRTDGTDGVSHEVSDEDQDVTTKYPTLKNWVIGCDAIAQFDNSSIDFFDKHTGSISTTCSFIP